MYKKVKKGFTIVELVIVIAVIAVLAAVLIPTFSNVIEKANQSADIQASRQMNTTLVTESIPTKPTEMKEVIKILAAAGFNSEDKLVPITKNLKFLWHIESNTIVLANVKDPEILYPTNDEDFKNELYDDLLVYIDDKSKFFDLAEGTLYLQGIPNDNNGKIDFLNSNLAEYLNKKENESLTDSDELSEYLNFLGFDKMSIKPDDDAVFIYVKNGLNIYLGNETIINMFFSVNNDGAEIYPNLYDSFDEDIAEKLEKEIKYYLNEFTNLVGCFPIEGEAKYTNGVDCTTSNGEYVFSCGEEVKGDIEISVQGGVGSIAENGFSSSYKNVEEITKITIGSGIISIGQQGFNGCKNLKTVIIGADVKEIGDNAFAACSSIEEFVVDENNEYFTSINGDLYSKEGSVLIRYAVAKDNNECDLSGNNNLVEISETAFEGCKKLTKIVLPDTVTKIGDQAFQYCEVLESITLPKNLAEISKNAFEGCTSLKSIEIPNSVTCIEEYGFEGCTSLESITIPNSVTSIGRSAFSRCTSLKEVIFEEGSQLTSIGSNAFSYCTSLESVYYKGTIEDWCRIAFYSDNSNPMYYAEHFYMLDENNEWHEVTEIVIPDTITSIGDYQFYGFDNITKVIIPTSVVSIGFKAFYNCTSLTIYCEALSQPTGWDSMWYFNVVEVKWGATVE